MPTLKQLAKPTLAIAGAVAAVAGGIAFADRRLIKRWRANPDPADGATPELRNATTVMVPRTDGTQLATHVVGDPTTQQTIVLVHGVTSNHDDWAYVADRLVDLDYAIVAIDQRGHGDSTVGSDGFGIGPQAADLAAALVHHDLHGVIVAGHSMGGMATLGLASWHRHVVDERVSGLGLVSTAASLARVDQRAGLRIGALGLDDKLPTDPARMRLAAGTFIFGTNPSLVQVDHAIASYLRCPPATRAGATGGMRTYDVREHLVTITCPSLVICGTHDRLTPLSLSEELADNLPNSTLEVLPGSGHMVIFENADLVADLLASLAKATRPA